MRINYHAPFAQRTGYARAAHDYCRALLAQPGVELRIIGTAEYNTANLDHIYAELVPCALEAPFEDPTDVVLHATSGPSHAREYIAKHITPARCRRTMITTWESDRMPDDVARGLASFDRIVVPSTYCRDAIEPAAAKLDVPVTVVPHAIDTEFWMRDSDRTRATPQYAFYAIGVPSARKNLGALILAFWTAFADDPDDVVLRIRSGVSPVMLDMLSHATGLPGACLARVQVADKHVDLDTIYAMHCESDCYVSASHGEGWDLACFEAVAVGNPTITPDWGGHLDYVRPLHGPPPHCLVEAPLCPAIAPPAVVGVRRMKDSDDVNLALLAGAPAGVDARQRWGDPSILAMSEAMRRMAHGWVGREGYAERSVRDPVAFAKRYNYGRVGAQLVEALTTDRMELVAGGAPRVTHHTT